MPALESARESLRTTRRALANPNLRKLQLGWAGAAIGQWAAGIAVTVYAFQKGGAEAAALLFVMRLVPSALAAPFVSTLADRRSKIGLMVTADVSRVVILLAMAALVASDAGLAPVAVAYMLAGVAGTAFEPSKQALLPELAREPDELTAANVVSSTIDSTSFFLGPAIGGAILAVANAETVLIVTAATYLWSALLVSRIRVAPAAAEEGEEASEPEAPESYLAAVRGGFSTVMHEPDVRLVVLLISAQTVVAGLEATLTAALAIDLLEIGGDGFGFLSSMIGVGGLIGAVAAVGLVGSRRLGMSFALGCVLWGIPFLLIGLVPEVAVAAIGLAIVGLANTLVDVSAITLLQRITAPEKLGRVFGIMESLVLGTIALGAALAPVLITLFGIEGALIAQGLFLPVMVAFAFAGLRRVDAAADVVVPGDVLALLRRVPIFAPLPAPVIERLATGAGEVRVPAGELVFAQGDPGDRFYVIEDGRVDVAIDGRHVREQGAGDSFGEIALLRDRPRTATIRALEDVVLRAIERDDFLGAVTGHATSADAADTVIARRMVFARPGVAAT